MAVEINCLFILLDKLRASLKPKLRSNVFIINLGWYKKQTDKRKGGLPPYDCIVIFKILILQRYYNVSDDAMEYAILDRLSFMRFYV